MDEGRFPIEPFHCRPLVGGMLKDQWRDVKKSKKIEKIKMIF